MVQSVDGVALRLVDLACLPVTGRQPRVGDRLAGTVVVLAEAE